jgi:translation initiation factor 2 beta subunit (eIF-2beta)/eIF-5
MTKKEKDAYKQIFENWIAEEWALPVSININNKTIIWYKTLENSRTEYYFLKEEDRNKYLSFLKKENGTDKHWNELSGRFKSDRALNKWNNYISWMTNLSIKENLL